MGLSLNGSSVWTAFNQTDSCIPQAANEPFKKPAGSRDTAQTQEPDKPK